ncbi:MAG TPA: DUF4835 family protein [Caldithrix abyssi]|uniref:DUF4835 family protein n=1 Tax=Caldithrix abyssi TaxID=187145 RepID=A0A7V5RQK8_CALAY|nr:DUF4835 family protein [Caldithrix abyssi]
MEKIMHYRFLIFLFVSFLALTGVKAQVLNVRVKLEYDHLNDDEKQNLVGLADKIDSYFNNYDWVDDEYETDVDCSVTIIIETVTDKTFEKLYKAQFVINSSSGENFYDRVWEFPYERSRGLSHNSGQFDPLTHFLDFYAYMVLAGELDTYDLLQGTPYYDKALDIANLALLSQYSRGWSARAEDVQKITSIRTRPLRVVKPDFFEALYEYEEGNFDAAYKLALKVYEGIREVYKQQPNNKYLRLFFEAHHKEIAALFQDHADILNALVDIDSKHRETYREYLPR